MDNLTAVQVGYQLLAIITPIGVIGAARMGVSVAVRGWKIVARMI